MSFQAFSAAVSHQEQVNFVKNYLGDVGNSLNTKFPSAKNKMLAYRVNQNDPLKQEQELVEGFDDDGETGAGEKLLGLLQKMEIENILIIVCIWNSSAQIGPSQVKGGELFKVIVDQAKELLTTIHDKIMQQEQELKQRQEEESNKALIGKKVAVTSKVYSLGAQQESNKTSPGLRGGSVFKTSALSKIQRNSPTSFGTTQHKLMFNSNSQDNSEGEEVTQRMAQTQMQIKASSPPRENFEEVEEKILSCFPDDLDAQDLEDATREVEESLKNLTKASLIELKGQSKPHPLVEKTMQVVCALRGFKNFQWQIAKDMVARPQFKMELIQTKPRTMRSEDVLKAQQILNHKANSALTPQNVHLHSEGAALLLIWAANLIKQYACHVKLGDTANQNNIGPLNLNDIQKITARTKIQVKMDQKGKPTYDIISIAKQQEQLQMNVNQTSKLKDLTQQHHSQLQQHDSVTSRQQMQFNQKSGSIGHFLQNKQMVFSVEGNQLEPEKKIETTDKQLVDISVIKKGGMNSVTNKSKAAQQQETQLLQQEQGKNTTLMVQRE